MTKHTRSKAPAKSHEKARPMVSERRRSREAGEWPRRKNAAGTPKPATTLSSLAAGIRADVERVRTSLASGMAAALDAGHKLIEAKKQCGHGRWEDWLIKNCQLSQSTAARYMRLAKRFPRGANLSSVTDLPMHQVLLLIAKPRGAADTEDTGRAPKVSASQLASGGARGVARSTDPEADDATPEANHATDGETDEAEEIPFATGTTSDKLDPADERDLTGDSSEDETHRKRQIADHADRCTIVDRLIRRDGLNHLEVRVMDALDHVFGELLDECFKLIARYARSHADVGERARCDQVTLEMILAGKLRAELDPDTAFSPESEAAA